MENNSQNVQHFCFYVSQWKESDTGCNDLKVMRKVHFSHFYFSYVVV